MTGQDSTSTSGCVAVRAALTSLAICLGACGSGGGGTSSSGSAASTAPPAGITGVDQSVKDPYTLLTVSGTGFDPGSNGLAVVFIPQSGSQPIAMPVSSLGFGTVSALVPALFDPGTGQSVPGTMDVEVVQFSPRAVIVTNKVKSVRLNSIRSGAAATMQHSQSASAATTAPPPGDRSRSFLSAMANVTSTQQAAAASLPGIANLSIALAQFSADLGSLRTAVNDVRVDPSRTVQLQGASGTSVPFDAGSLALLDNLVAAVAATLVREGAIPAATSVIGCPTATGDSTFDSQVCSIQTYFSGLNNTVTPGLSYGPAAAVIDLIMGGIGASAATAAVSSASAAKATLAAQQIGWIVLAPCLSAYAVAKAQGQSLTSPAGTDLLAVDTTPLLNQLLLNHAPVLESAFDVVGVYAVSAQDAPPTAALDAGLVAPIRGGADYIYSGNQLRVSVPTQPGSYDPTKLLLP